MIVYSDTQSSGKKQDTNIKLVPPDSPVPTLFKKTGTVDICNHRYL